MRAFFKTMLANAGVAGEFIAFLWQQRLFWMIPMVVVLLLFGMLKSEE